MVEIEMKPDTQRPRWFAPSDADSDMNHFHWRVSSRQHAWRPPTDVYVTDEAVIVRMEIAGMRDGEFSISLEDHTLTVSGSRSDQPEQRAYHQMEIRFGEFRTEVGLHWPVDTDNIDAEYKDGFLRVILPITIPHNVEIQE